MKKVLSFAAVVILLALLAPVSPARAAGPLDEIKNYTVTVNPRKDGTLDMIYHIDWLVLDSTSEGPLTWVKVGIPNSHVDEIQAATPNIKKIRYLSDSGSWVRIDLDRAYNAGETVSLVFSIHQSFMYRLDTAANTCSYTFVPGWFDEITVDAMSIIWNKTDVIYSDATGEEGGYLTWTTSLTPGQRLTAIIRYSSSTFSTSESGQAQEDTGYVYTGTVSSSGSVGGGLAVIFIIIVFAVIIAISAGTGGRYRGGFWGGGFHGGGRGGGGCACACAGCACACACAGGGRAGCSVKHFYGGAVDTVKLKERLIK